MVVVAVLVVLLLVVLLLGDHTMGGGPLTRNTKPYIRFFSVAPKMAAVLRYFQQVATKGWWPHRSGLMGGPRWGHEPRCCS